MSLSSEFLSPWLLGLLGLCIGSFLNVVIYRFPVMLERQWWGDVAQQLADVDSWRRVFGRDPPAGSTEVSAALQQAITALPTLGLARPASRCPSCGHVLHWHENIPLLGWLRLKGRCAACGTRISPRYPMIELLTAGAFVAVSWRFGPTLEALIWCAVVATLIALAMIDWDTTVLPDAMTLPLLWAGLTAAALDFTLPLAGALWGAVVGYLSLWSIYWVFKLVTGQGSPHMLWQVEYWTARAASGKEGMGYGDFKLLAALGAWLGWQAIVPIVLFASVLGAIIGIGMKLRQSLREGRYVPFGPFLAGGGLVVMLVGMPTVLELMGWR